MNLSIVILTCNQLALTERCLRSISGLAGNPDYEIILVDNGSSDGTASRIAELFPGVICISLPENLGVAGGRNAGAARARGKRIMFLDNDTVASSEAILQLERYLDEHPRCGVVAPRLIDPQGNTQESYKDFPGIGLKVRNWLGKRKDCSEKPVPRHETMPFYVIGAAQMFPRDVFERVGGLDDNIFFGPEDADFCMAVRNLGLNVVYNPSVTIMHDWQRSTSARKLSRRAFLHAKALLYFYFKHKRLF